MNFVTVNVALLPANSFHLPITMPGATTVLYAAKRAAEEYGLDPDEAEYGLIRDSYMLDQGDVIADHAGQQLLLVRLG